MAWFCSKCGAPLQEESRFCGECGQAVAEEPLAPQPQLPQPQRIPIQDTPVLPQPAKQQSEDKEKDDRPWWLKALCTLLIFFVFVEVRYYMKHGTVILPPQIMSLLHLMQYEDVAQAMGAARRQPPPVILPEGFDEGDTRVLCYPGDPHHPVRQRALPGPTRLEYRHKRFQPPGGFGALLGL